MAHKLAMPFDPKAFLAIVGSGKTILKVKKNQVFLSQAEFNEYCNVVRFRRHSKQLRCFGSFGHGGKRYGDHRAGG